MTSLRIIGTDLPGRACGSLTNIHVGLQTGLEICQVVPGDVHRVVFETTLDIVQDDDGRFDFGGPAVRGRPNRRFIFLSWGDPDDAGFHLFRRAKILLGDVEPTVVAGALLDGALEGTLSLSDGGELPRSGVIRPPTIRWSAMTAPRFAPGLYEPRLQL